MMRKLKIAYLLHWNDGPASGVFKKVVRQTKIWQETGHQISIHVISRGNWEDDWRDHFPEAKVFYHQYTNFQSRWRVWRDAAQQLSQLGPSLVYFRYDLYMPGMGELARRTPLIIEVNTDDYKEFCLQLGLRCLHNRLTRAQLFSSAAGVVYTTYELAKRPYFSRFQKPYEVIANGIDLNAIPLTPPPASKHPRLIFMGSDGLPWHGTDKMVWLAAQKPDWRFDLIGGHHQPDAPANVTFHGILDRDAYGTLMADADVAIGSLAAYRKGMDEACPLKTREYLAFGLPVIIAYQDTDFPHGAPFLLQLPNTETNVVEHLDQIDAFVAAWKGKRVERADVQHLDVAMKEKRRLAFFERVLRGE